jgi:hypothetical protein
MASAIRIGKPLTPNEMRTPPAYGALGFSKRQATALINGVFLF